MSKVMVLIGMGILGAASVGYSYDWQKHIPKEVQEYTPEMKGDGPSSSQSFGVASLTGKITLSKHMGPLSLVDSQVIGPINVFGTLTAVRTDFHDLLTCHGCVTLNGSDQGNKVRGSVEVYGPVTAKGISFDKDVTIFGPLSGTMCSFKAPIKIYTSKITLKDCQITHLDIHDREDKPVEIDLENVHISGRITAKSGLGTITAKNTVINGEMLSGITFNS